ncbi:MAG: TraB/GumN family protein [Flavobacteriales bacterium]|nr:MAG: TraB/GumN family protein [Flavobacteriales bacterium]
MKNFTLIFLSLCCIAFSQTNAQEQSLLYKLEGKDIKTSYIFGTIHMLPQEDFHMPQKVKDAFEQSDELYLELDMDDPKMMRKMMSKMMLAQDDELANHVDSTEYKLLDAYLKENVGMSFGQFNRFKPLYLSSTVVASLVGKQIVSFEMRFINMAKAAKKELKGLETVEEQIAIFDNISYEEQMDDLVEMLEDPAEAKELFDNMVSVYKSEQIDSLFNYTLSYFDNDKEMINNLLLNRNKKWVEIIPKISKDKKVLYAVGAGHLGGKQGVIQLLRDKGYKVTPVLD